MSEHQRITTDVLHEVSDLEESFRFCPRYDRHELTDDQIEEIAERAAKKAVLSAKNEMYQGVGKTVVGWAFYVVGAVAIGIFVMGIKFGWIKP